MMDKIKEENYAAEADSKEAEEKMETVQQESEQQEEKEPMNSMMEDVAKAIPMAGKRYLKGFFSKGTIATLLICAAIIISGKCMNLVRVVGDSMNPTFENGNLLITVKNNVEDKNDVNYYDVVVCDLSDRPEIVKILSGSMIIKRIVGVPGDTISIKDGELYRNGTKIDEEYAKMIESISKDIAKDELVLGKDEFFVLGDNRNNSYDSRFIGPITEEEITNIIKCRLLF